MVCRVTKQEEEKKKGKMKRRLFWKKKCNKSGSKELNERWGMCVRAYYSYNGSLTCVCHAWPPFMVFLFQSFHVRV